ncbi:hypothetical protein LJC60_03080 [Ruminococcaceae bacterium OttesenSCG-928-D13]|nr:hypothetical protein [Ruminococcaceae bacterium OttesenSCG-928-D13]
MQPAFEGGGNIKKFAFSLQRMLGFKRTLYEKERNTLAQLRAERLVLFTRRENTEHQMLASDAAFRDKAATEGVRFAEVAAQAYKRESADALCKSLDLDIANKDVEIEAQLQVVIALDKEVKSLEKLRESQWDEYVAELAREENERILEIVSNKFASEQAEAAAMEAAQLAEETANARIREMAVAR